MNLLGWCQSLSVFGEELGKVVKKHMCFQTNQKSLHMKHGYKHQENKILALLYIRKNHKPKRFFMESISVVDLVANHLDLLNESILKLDHVHRELSLAHR